MILSDEQRDVCKLAIEIYGIDNQIFQSLEEMAELTKALLKLRRSDLKESEINKRILEVEEEIADVMIMMTQLEMIFDAEHIQGEANAKIERLAGRLHEEV